MQTIQPKTRTNPAHFGLKWHQFKKGTLFYYPNQPNDLFEIRSAVKSAKRLEYQPDHTYYKVAVRPIKIQGDQVVFTGPVERREIAVFNQTLENECLIWVNRPNGK
ncbi:MAG: hypothetical protein VKJ06_01280 [Vampirovibrionales bacterium]|nr:hypothetical protein [Vampirovibrionales bacterium]